MKVLDDVETILQLFVQPKYPQVSFSTPFEPRTTTTILLGLTSIRPPPTLFLVPAHTRSELDIHPRRRREAKALGHFDKI